MKQLVSIILVTAFLSALSMRGESQIGLVNNRPVLTVNDSPMLILAGELGNSTVTSQEDIVTNIEKISGHNLNTILVPAYWELIEPEEGTFDFTLIDEVIDRAKENNLKVVFLWFGAWKNSMSCYAPEWVKKDTTRFPRARTSNGKPLEILSVFSENVLDADLNAFEAFLNHIKEYDGEDNVIMIQVENEIGMLEDARDHSGLADEEYDKGVPSELMVYVKDHRDGLHPALADKWKINGNGMSGSWSDVFGRDLYTDEYFMAWNYAKYIEKLASRGKTILNLPFYLNAALNSRGRKPGEYPSAGPLAHLKDIWHAAAPSIDFLSPDIYDTGFEDWVKEYAFEDNLLFVPEVKRDKSNPAQAYYIVGHHDAIGFSPFSIENGDDDYFSDLSKAYKTLSELTPLLVKYGDKGWTDGVLLSADRPDKVIEDDLMRITLSHYFTLPWDPRASDKNNWNDSGAIIMKIAPEEFILAGSGVVVKFEDILEREEKLNLGEDGFVSSGNQEIVTASRKTPRIGLAGVEEIKVKPDGSFTRIRSFNGDETHQGRHVRIGVDDHKILHIKTYRYE